MSAPVELVIVGAGPAGMAAAVTASRAGVEVVVIDTCPKTGGQYFKQIPDALRDEKRDDHTSKKHRILEQLKSSNVQIFNNTLVWGIFEGASPGTWRLKLHGPGVPKTLDARKIIIATGAYDRSVPFPGWDLPGVITTGAALTMVKYQGVLPGKRVILSGTGPLQLAAAAVLVRAGAEVLGVCESATGLMRRGVTYLPAAWGQWGRMGEGVGYIKTLFSAGVPYRLGWSIKSVEGGEKVSQATIAKLDGSSRPIPHTEITQAVDAVVAGYSLTPGTELCRQLDCTMSFNEKLGVFIPQRTEEMETSSPGIYAVGDCAGVGGAEMAMIEGNIAGYCVAAKLGHISGQALLQEVARENLALHREQHFARFLNNIFSPPPELYRLADPDTVICRCEQITLGQIREAIACGAQSVSDVKNLLRTGMGNCQGRTCGNIVAQILANETGRTLQEVGYLNMRPPIHPLPLGEIEEPYPSAELASQGAASL